MNDAVYIEEISCDGAHPVVCCRACSSWGFRSIDGSERPVGGALEPMADVVRIKVLSGYCPFGINAESGGTLTGAGHAAEP